MVKYIIKAIRLNILLFLSFGMSVFLVVHALVTGDLWQMRYVAFMCGVWAFLGGVSFVMSDDMHRHTKKLLTETDMLLSQMKTISEALEKYPELKHMNQEQINALLTRPVNEIAYRDE